MREVWVDFNAADADGNLFTVSVDAPSLQVGERVIAKDHDGNRCEAIVTSIDSGRLVALAFKGRDFVSGEVLTEAGDTAG